MRWPKRVHFAASLTVEGYDELCPTLGEARAIVRKRNANKFLGVSDWTAVTYVLESARR